MLTYYDGSQPQYAHLRASTLAYTHINLVSMLVRFEHTEAVRVATDSIYIRKTALRKLEVGKLFGYEGKDHAKRLPGFDLKVSHVLQLH